MIVRAKCKTLVREENIVIRHEKILGYLYVLPVVVLVCTLIIYPILHSMRLSFLNVYLLKKTSSFVGLDQYKELLTKDPYLPLVANNTLWWIIIATVGSIGIGFLLALFLNVKVKFQNLLRILIFIPWIAPEVVIAGIWKYIFDGSSGILNEVLLRLGLIDAYVPWLSSIKTVLFADVFVQIWRNYTFVTILFLAGLQAIPKELYESAEIDGATKFQLLIYITIPQLRTMIAFATLIIVLWSFNTFAIPFIMSAGGPLYRSTIIPIYIYNIGIQFFKISKAAALSNMLFVFIFIFSITYVFSLKVTKEE